MNIHLKTVSWETYHPSGALKDVSKSHYIDPQNKDFTLCGRRIERTGGWDNDLCYRCERKDEKLRSV